MIPERIKTLLWPALALAIVAIIAATQFSAARKPAAPQATASRPVRTVTVDPQPIEDDRQAIGEIRARTESSIGFRVSGKVVSRAVDVGVSVKVGDLLARLDEQDFQHKLRSAEADVTSAEAVLVEARSAEERLGQLLAKGITPRANYDAALRNLRSSEAKLESATAALELAKDQLKYADLRADFGGIVTAVGAEPGQVVNVGQMVVKLAKPDEVDAVFNIAESAFRDRKPEDRPQIHVALLSNTSITAEGRVREVSPVADATTRTYQVKVTLADPPPQMRFGASVIGRLKETTAPVVVLPGSALYDQAGKPAVWIVDQKSSAVALQPVTVSRFDSERVVIADGLKKGDVVVTAGVNRLQKGQKVRIGTGGTP